MDIQLIDNTAPAERAADEAAFFRTTTATSAGNITKLRSRPSIRDELMRRKYAKWQAGRLGVGGDSAAESEQQSSDETELQRAGTNTNTLTNASTIHEANEGDHHTDLQSPTRNAEDVQNAGARTTHQSPNHPKICGLQAGSELDILYENQRGWFFFGIPLYSSRSLLNLDPAPWITADGQKSFVNITNAQVPDPSWKWVWRTWYVDMSGDVDEQGWQYAFSFLSSSSWHGTHPFCYSFVRRRRWVRLRVKRVSDRGRRGETELEMAHRLTEDYFTIHSAVKSKRATSSERASRVASVNLGRAAAEAEDDREGYLEEIRNIPSLMVALKAAIVDREKLDAVKRFAEEGGDELYYLDEKIPEVMSRFVYQTSRWQLLTHLKDTIHNISLQEKEKVSDATDQETEALQRKREYLSKAAVTARSHLIGPEVLHEPSQIHKRESTTEMFDLTLGTRRNSLLSQFSGKFSFKPMDNGGVIKGIPQKAEIGHDVHIY